MFSQTFIWKFMRTKVNMINIHPRHSQYSLYIMFKPVNCENTPAKVLRYKDSLLVECRSSASMLFRRSFQPVKHQFA